MLSVLCQPRSLTIALGLLAALTFTAATPTPAPAEEKVKILFLPPPMEGNISLGIYNSEGKLVRVLHDQAATDEFHPAFNGLITHWDGKDDSGNRCPAGKYRARGYLVGDLKAEGIDYHGNDWYVDDDSPRLRRLTRIAGLSGNRLLIEALQPGSDTPALFIASRTPAEKETGENASDASDASDTSEDTQVWKVALAPAETTFPAQELYQKPDSPAFSSMKELSRPGDHTWAPNGMLWGIDGKTIREYAASGEVERELISVDEALTPIRISATESLLFVLGESAIEQRLRGLSYDSPGEALVDNGILFTDTVGQAQPLLIFPDGMPLTAADPLTVPLIDNPLLEGKKAGSLKMRVAATSEGTVLTTDDGLPLMSISTTPHLRWAVAGQQKDRSSITLFESDGAVLAEYRISAPENLMAFDAGVYKLHREAESPVNPDQAKPSADPSPSPEGAPSPEITPAQPTAKPAPSPTPATNHAENENF